MSIEGWIDYLEEAGPREGDELRDLLQPFIVSILHFFIICKMGVFIGYKSKKVIGVIFKKFCHFSTFTIKIKYLFSKNLEL